MSAEAKSNPDYTVERIKLPARNLYDHQIQLSNTSWRICQSKKDIFLAIYKDI